MNKFFRKKKKILISIFLLILLYFLIPLPESFFEDEYSTIVVDENEELLRVFLNKDQQWYFPPEKGRKIPEKLKTSIINFEDRYFYYHPGINPFSITRAIFQNIFSGKIKSGASTISMQVIRIHGKRRRTFWNKIIEILQAVKLEIKYSKEDILKMYINHAPYGGNIIGYRAASLKYFGKPPDSLTWNEAAILAVLPNSPGLISPVINKKKLIRKKNQLLKTLLKRNKINRSVFEAGISEPVSGKIKKFPMVAPHFSETIKQNYGNRFKLIRSTIIKKHQVRMENLLNDHQKYLKTLGITNSAMIVVETETGKVRAYCGSHDFFDEINNGQVDGVFAKRSSGSVLKPFLYALSIDEGLILEKTLIKDVPSYFGSFSPSNADKNFNGVVSAKEALIRSLNVPAVRLLNYYGLHKFFFFLKSAGVSTLFRAPDEYGLTLILGGAEISLFDLAKLYTGLGNLGVFRPLKMVYEDLPVPVKTGTRLLNPGASYLTLEILKELKRPGSEFYWEQYQSGYPFAWKTGTSYGQRDAWAVGVNPQWTIAVWAGNFNGEGNRNISGASCAAPIMFDVLNYLPKEEKLRWFRKENISFKKINICADTGYQAGPDCERVLTVDSPDNSKVLRICPYHKTIFTTLDGKTRVCSLCWEKNNYKKVKKLYFTPDVIQFLRERGDIIPQLPPHNKDCSSTGDSNPLKIVYPVPNAKLWIPREFNRELQNATFTVAHRVKGREIFWYIDDVFRGVTKERHKMIFELNEGWHKLLVVDEEGNRDSKRFYVLFTSGHR
ncbi:MAG: penicillin-binding protein 1C [Acidobacteriota bacterium]